MPLPSSVHGPRRVHRKLITDEEIDLRRARGEISCAECRRLKLKCDKKLPCGSCVRRGCPSICPNGSLSTGQGTRFVLADTPQLHAKITEMGQRIRQLEDALAIFQSSVSNETHPLLRDELLNIKFGPDTGLQTEVKEPDEVPGASETIDALGTLTIDEGGRAKYFGRSAGSEALFLAGAEMENLLPGGADETDVPQISIEIARLSNAFPFGVEGSPERAMDLILDYLPTQPRAWALCEVYIEHASWSFRPIKRDEIIDDFLTPIYRFVKEKQRSGISSPEMLSYHKLAVLFLVFAIGALVDLTLDAYNSESDTYYHLARACLSMRSVFDSPELATVQAVSLVGAYHNLGGKVSTLDSTWALMSLACKLAQGHGLHRESARFAFDAKTVQRKRHLFWELFTTDHFYSLATGRPPSIRLSYVDCEFPEDDTAPVDRDGNVLKGYYRWKFEFAKEIFATVTEVTLTAAAPNYQTLLELDRKVREKALPPHLNIFMSLDDERCTPSAYMRGCLAGQFRAVTLSYIHRNFFVQAMLDHPTNPLRSPYAPSFLAAYRCASGVIKTSINHFDRFPELCCRWWFLWTHLFSAAIIVGSIVTQSPSSTMASSAFIELGLACDLFEKGATHSQRARSGWAVLCKLKEKAFQVYSQFRSGNPFPNPLLSTGKADYGNDELALFGGQTRILMSRMFKTTGKREQSSSGHGSPGSSSESDFKSPDSPDVHPSLVEYLSTIPADSSATMSQSPPTTLGLVQPTSYQYIGRQDVQAPIWQPSGMTSPMPPLETYPGQQQQQQQQQHASFPPHEPYTTQALTGTYSHSHYGRDEHLQESSVDFDTMMSGGSGMDEHWISFMRASGLFAGTSNNYSAIARRNY